VTRALITIHSDTDRQRAANWCKNAPAGTRVEFKKSKRSLTQNNYLWSVLTQIAADATHNGRKYNTSQWKCLFLAAMGKEAEFIPTLDGKGFIAYGQSSSDLSREEMTALLDFIDAWCAQNGIILHHPAEEAVA
jgi:hypothetical protein